MRFVEITRAVFLSWTWSWNMWKTIDSKSLNVLVHVLHENEETTGGRVDAADPGRMKLPVVLVRPAGAIRGVILLATGEHLGTAWWLVVVWFLVTICGGRVAACDPGRANCEDPWKPSSWMKYGSLLYRCQSGMLEWKLVLFTVVLLLSSNAILSQISENATVIFY